MNLIQAFEERVGEHRVEVRQNPLHPEQSLIFMFLELQVPVTIVMTKGLSDYKMPVSPKWEGREFNEIFFCLPTYWDFDDVSNDNQNWIYTWLFKLENFVREKQTWFGPGHTIPAGNPPASISTTMKQDHFIFLDPMFTEDAMHSMELDGKTIHFLAIVPIFGDEVDYKMVKGTYKVVKKFLNKKFNECLDDYRSSFMKSRMRFW
jgi:hypothetical protein